MAGDKDEYIDQPKRSEEGNIEEDKIDKRAIIEEEDDEKEEEARTIKGKRPVRQPTREEYEEHMRTHLPFRKWCPHCAKGKRKNDPRRTDKEREENEVPTMSWDYMEQRGKDGKIENIEDGRNKTLIGIDRVNKWISAIVVPKKGIDPYAVGAVGREINNSGFNRVIVKSVQEPAIRALLEAVKNERGDELTLESKVEMIPEKSPVAESRANGEVERYVQTVQGQVRTLKTALESRYQMKIGEAHNVLPWLIMYAAILINICSIGEDGKTAYERRRGKSFKREIPEFGESIWYLRPGSAGKDKLDERWGDGVYLGIIEESLEIYVGTKEGIIKVRTFARRGEADRWRKKEIEEMVGVPWEPVPGRGMKEVKSKVHIAGVGAGEDIIEEPQLRGAIPRRMRFDADDLDKYGYTFGCPGCRAKNRGDIAVNHSEECRRRIEEKIREADPERYMRTLGRLAEGTLKEGTLKEGTLRKEKGHERRAKHFEVRKKLKQKEDRKEERREEMRRKSVHGAQGENMDRDKTWTCTKCKTINEESYKFCMECANRNPQRSIEEVASSSSEPPAYRRKAEEEEKENHRKRKAEEGSMREDERDRRKKEEDSKGSLTKEGGETRGDIDKTMNVDMMEEEEFQERKTDLRENKIPLVILQGTNWKRIAQMGEIQNTGGEFYIWEMPRKMNTAVINSRMRNIGGPGVIVKDTKIWTNSDRVKEKRELTKN